MITTQNYSLEQGGQGFMVYVPTPSNIKRQTEYVLYFDKPINFPKNPPTTVTFEPQSGSYSIQGSNNFIPKIFMKVKTLQKIQTKTLLRLIIKDTKNNILHIDYILIVCSPQSEVNVSGTLLVYSQGVSPLGPNGGSLIQLDDTTGSSSSITVGSSVTGPGLIPSAVIEGVVSTNPGRFFVRSILPNNVIELNVPFRFVAGIPYNGIFSFVNSIGCIDPNNIIYNDSSSVYTALDYNNNWTYIVRDQVIIKFIVENPEENQDTVVLLPVKNTALLGSPESPQPIPAVSALKGGGRVIGDTIPISDF